MSLVKCPDCGKSVSDLAPACIGCGRPMIVPIQKAASGQSEPPSRATSFHSHAQRTEANSAQYYIKGREGKDHGPFTPTELRQQYAQGLFTSLDYVRRGNSMEYEDPSLILGGLTGPSRYEIMGSTDSTTLTLEELRQRISSGKMKYADRVRAEYTSEWVDLYQVLLNVGSQSSPKPQSQSQPVHNPSLIVSRPVEESSLPEERSTKEKRTEDGRFTSMNATLSPDSSPVGIGMLGSSVGAGSKSKRSLWSWKSLGLAFLLALIINVFAAASSGGRAPKNISWTVMWMYLSIEAWKYWRWKALLPYPLFGLASAAIGLIMVGDNVEKLSWTYIVIKAFLNIGGLIAFSITLNKARKGNENPQGIA